MGFLVTFGYKPGQEGGSLSPVANAAVAGASGAVRGEGRGGLGITFATVAALAA